MALFLDKIDSELKPALALYELAKNIAALDDSEKTKTLSDLVEYLSGDDEQPDSSLAALGVNSSLKDLYNQLNSSVTDPVEKLSVLLKQLDELSGELPMNWPWSRETGDRDITNGEDITLTLGANIQLETTFNYDSTKGLVEYSITGELGFQSKLGVPFQYGALSSSLEAEGTAKLLYAFSHGGDTPLYQVLENDLKNLSAVLTPKDLPGVGNLDHIALEASGSIKFGSEISVGKSWGTQWNVKSDNVDKAGAVTASVKAEVSFGVDWSKSGAYQVTITPQSGGQLLISISDKDELKQSHSFSAGANIKITGADQVIDPLIKKYSKWPEAVIDFVNEYSAPGDLLKQALSTYLQGQPDAVKRLGQILLGDENAETLADELAAKFKEVVDERTIDYVGVLESKKEEIIKSVIAKLPVQAQDIPEIETTLGEWYDKAVETLQTDLLDKIKNLPDDTLEKIAATLNGYGQDVNNLIAKVNEKADQLLAPVKTLIGKYQVIKGKLKKAVDAVSREQLSIKYSRVVSKRENSDVMLALKLDVSGGEGQSRYREILGGDLEQVVIDANKGASYVTIEDSLIKEMFGQTISTSFNFNLFGIGLSATDILDSELNLEYDATGNVSLYVDNAYLEKVRKAFGASQSVRLATAVMLAGTPDPDQSPLSLRINYTGEKPKLDKLVQFFSSVEKAGELKAGTTDTLKSDVLPKAIDGADKDTAITVDIAFTMNKLELKQAADVSEDVTEKEAIKTQVAMLKKIRIGEAAQLDDLSAMAEQIMTSASGDRLAAMLIAFKDQPISRFDFQILRRYLPSQQLRRNMDKRLAKTIIDNGTELEMFLTEMQELMNSPVPAVQADGKIDPQSSRMFEEANKKNIALLKDWVTARGRMTFREDVSAWSLAFISTLKELSGSDDVFLMPVVTWTQDGLENKYVVV